MATFRTVLKSYHLQDHESKNVACIRRKCCSIYLYFSIQMTMTTPLFKYLYMPQTRN